MTRCFGLYKTSAAKENANDTIEKPAILQLLGDVTDANILDLGCGNAGFGVELLEQGCFSYTGVDGSINMINAAQQQLSNYPNARVLHESMEHYTPPRDTYDLVTARLSLHYIEDLASMFIKVNQALKPEGRFVFPLNIQSLLLLFSLPLYAQTGRWITTSSRDSVSSTGWVDTFKSIIAPLKSTFL